MELKKGKSVVKTAKILKKSVLNPGNNWITLLNSAKIIKKNAVTPVNFHLYHYAGNNPVRYTDPDGRAYFGKRPLGTTVKLPKIIEKIMSLKIFDFFNLELKHEHLFFEDGKNNPANIGWTWGDYVFYEENASTIASYTKIPKYYDDNLMREAIANVKETFQAKKSEDAKIKYSLAGSFLNKILLKAKPELQSKIGDVNGKKNNCQDYARKVRREYWKLYRKLSREDRAKIRETKRIKEQEWRAQND